MSGSSLDGLDLALCEFRTEHDFTLNRAATITYTADWIRRLSKVSNLSHHDVSLLEAEFTTVSAEMILEFLDGTLPDFISSHGHTILHNPAKGYSYQLGNGAYLSAKTGIPVISEFRLQDIAKGGQGAPIAPAVEKYLLDKYDAYLNLGGISNISFHSPTGILAFDIGPCNQLLNALAEIAGKSYDRDGILASEGEIIDELLKQALTHPYFQETPPKSLDNSFVKHEFVKPFLSYEASIKDKLRTAVEYIVETIVNNSKENSQLYATGGGALNIFLVKRLQEELKKLNTELVMPDRQIIEFKEAILMSLMGYLRVNNKVNVFSSVTGATSDTVAGCIYTC